jgi:hypothetical protein
MNGIDEIFDHFKAKNNQNWYFFTKDWVVGASSVIRSTILLQITLFAIIQELSVTLAPTILPVLRIGDVYPGSEFFHPGSPRSRIPDPGSKRLRIPDLDPHQRILVFLTQKNCF